MRGGWESVTFEIPWRDNGGWRPSIVKAIRRRFADGQGPIEEVVLEYDKYISSSEPCGGHHHRVTEIRTWTDVSRYGAA